MPEVSFFIEDIDFSLSNPDKTIDWIKRVVRDEGHKLVKLNYIFCSDQYIHNINMEYLSHDFYTDIITFDQSDNKMDIEGDIYISIERVKENADQLATPFLHELHRVIVHGILHLMGYNDKSTEQENSMRKKEDSFLSLYFE